MEINLSRKNKRPLYFILCGLLSFYIGFLLFEYVFREERVTHVFCLFGIGILLIGYVAAFKTLKGIETIVKGVICFYLIVCAINVIIGVPLSLMSGNTVVLLYSKQMMWMYLIGFALLIPFDRTNVRQLILFAKLYVILSLCFSLYNFNDFFRQPEEVMAAQIGWESFVMKRPRESAQLLYPIGAFFIFFLRFRKLWKFLIIAAFILAIGAAMLAGRRSSVAILLGEALIAIAVYVKYRKAILFLIPIFGILLFATFANEKTENIMEEYFPILYDRIDVDSRSDTEKDFYKDMDDPLEWVIGRSMAGTYKSKSVWGRDDLNRHSIETGWLNIVLHGGLLMLIPYVFLLLYAFIKGFFKSNSLFVKYCATIVLFYLLLLYPDGTPLLTLDFFILFSFIRICISPQWIHYSDQDVENVILR